MMGEPEAVDNEFAAEERDEPIAAPPVVAQDDRTADIMRLLEILRSGGYECELAQDTLQ